MRKNILIITSCLVLLFILSCREDEKPDSVPGTPANKTLQDIFAKAALEFQVNKQVLLAVAKYESNFDPVSNTGLSTPAVVLRGHGLMNLTREMNKEAGSLSNEDNLRSYAKLLKEESKRTDPQNIQDWVRVAATIAHPDEKMRPFFTKAIIDILTKGFDVVTLSGQKISLNPVKIEGKVNYEFGSESVGHLMGQCEATRIPCVFINANEKNIIPVQAGRNVGDIKHIVLHSCESNLTECMSWFRNDISRMSGHFIIGPDGSIIQMVRLKSVAQDIRDTVLSASTISIFFAGKTGTYQDGTPVSENPDWLTKESYLAAAELVSYLIERFRIPIDSDYSNRSSIISYADLIPDDSTIQGLGGFMDWEYLLALINNKNGDLPGTLTIDSPLLNQSIGNSFDIKLSFSKETYYIDIYFDYITSISGNWYRFVTLETLEETHRSFHRTFRHTGVGHTPVRWIMVKSYDENHNLIARDQSRFFLNDR